MSPERELALNQKQQTPLPPPPRDEEPPNVDVPLEHQTQESLIAYIQSLEKEAKQDGMRRAELQEALKKYGGHIHDSNGNLCGILIDSRRFSCSCGLDAFAPAPKENPKPSDSAIE